MVWRLIGMHLTIPCYVCTTKLGNLTSPENPNLRILSAEKSDVQCNQQRISQHRKWKKKKKIGLIRTILDPKIRIQVMYLQTKGNLIPNMRMSCESSDPEYNHTEKMQPQ